MNASVKMGIDQIKEVHRFHGYQCQLAILNRSRKRGTVIEEEDVPSSLIANR